MYNIPRYQTGSYIPGLSSQVFGAGLDRDIASEQDRLRNQAKSLGKKQQWGNIGSILGKSGGKWLGKALSAGFAATNPLYALAVQAGGAGLGSYLGSKLGRGDDVSVKSKHGLLGSQYEDIDKYQKGMESAAKGAAWGDAGSVFGQGLKSEAGKQIWSELDADKKTNWLGKNIGSKTHKELTGMKLGDVLGQGRIAKGLEERLGKNKPFESEIGQWAWDTDKDIYGDITARKREPGLFDAIQQGGQSLYDYMLPNRKQEGGIMGLQEGGSPEEVNMDDVLKRKMLMERFGNVFNQELDENDRIANYQKARRQMDLSSGLWVESPDDSAFTAVGGLTGQRGNLTDEEYFGGLRNLEAEQKMLRDMFRSSLTSRQPEGMQSGGMAYPLQMAGGGYLPQQGFGGLIQYRKGY
jgi:hypothetical protein